MYMNPPQLGKASFETYLRSFHWTVWVTLLGSAAAIAISLAITDYFYPDKFARYKLLMSIFFSISSLTQGAYFDPPQRAGGIIIMSFWWLFCLFVVVIWATNYTAILAKENTQQKLTSFYVSHIIKKNYCSSFEYLYRHCSSRETTNTWPSMIVSLLTTWQVILTHTLKPYIG